ncbi:MAG: hypothetical protein VX589_07485 [Myxococcota bacterium]|nr:hypothetical protein [Myxococcota bacterium]
MFVASAPASTKQTQFGLPIPNLSALTRSATPSDKPSSEAGHADEFPGDAASETLAFTQAELDAQYAEWAATHKERSPLPATAPQDRPDHESLANEIVPSRWDDGAMPELGRPGARRMSWKDSALATDPTSALQKSEDALTDAQPNPNRSNFTMGDGQPYESEPGMGSLDESGWGIEYKGPLDDLRRRTRSKSGRAWPVFLIYLGIFALLIAGGLIGYGYIVRPATELNIEHIEPRIRDGRLFLDVPVTADAPTTLRYPGGVKNIDGHAQIGFSLKASTLPLQRTHIKLFSERDEVQTEYVLNVDAYYRIRPVSISARGLESVITHRAGWKLKISPGELTPVTAKTSRWFVPFQVMPRTLSAAVDVLGPDGRQLAFSHRLDIPLAGTPLRLTEPLRDQVYTEPGVVFKGATLPGTRIRISNTEVVADEHGFFQTTIQIDADGLAQVPVIAAGDGRHERRVTVEVFRGDKTTVQKARRAEIKRSEVALAEAKKAPAYTTLEGGWPPSAGNETVAFQGVVRGMYRAPNEGNRLLISMCTLPRTCPAWVSVTAFVPTKIGQPVKFVGRWIGHHVYENVEGKKVSIPKFEAQSMLP